MKKSKEELCLMTLKNDAKFEEKMILGSKSDMRNLVNFNASSGKFGKLQFDVFKKLWFTPCKAEQPLRGMELQEIEAQQDCSIYQICLERTYS